MIILLQILQRVNKPSHRTLIREMLLKKDLFAVKDFILKVHGIELSPMQEVHLTRIANRPRSIEAAFNLVGEL